MRRRGVRISLMLKITICDDNSSTISEIYDGIVSLYGNNALFCYASSAEDFGNEECSNCDILIIDIDLMESDGTDSGGIKIAEQLKQTNPDLQVIFVSAFHEYAQDIFKVDPVYYLQKPVALADLKSAMDKALSEIRKLKDERFVITTSSDIVNIPINQILYFESDKRLMRVFTNEKDYSFYSRVRDVELRLDSRFVKCHQSFIVNLEHVKSMRSDSLILDNGSIIPVSQSRHKLVRVTLTKYLGETII